VSQQPIALGPSIWNEMRISDHWPMARPCGRKWIDVAWTMPFQRPNASAAAADARRWVLG